METAHCFVATEDEMRPWKGPYFDKFKLSNYDVDRQRQDIGKYSKFTLIRAAPQFDKELDYKRPQVKPHHGTDP